MKKLKLKKILIVIICVIFVLVVLLLLSWKFDWESPYEKKLKRQGEEVVLKVESFKQEHGRLPNNLTEMELPESEEGPIFYDKRKDNINYIVSFSGSTLGESTYYASEDGLWHDF